MLPPSPCSRPLPDSCLTGPREGVGIQAGGTILWESRPMTTNRSTNVLVRHEGQSPRERSACGWRDRLISREDVDAGVAAWAHAVDIDGAKLHYHKVATELYYVLEGAGSVNLDGVDHEVRKGSVVHIPPGVVHGATGKMRVLVIGIPDVSDEDYFEAAHDETTSC